MIISILNQKGGVGKTTLAVNIARAYTKRGVKTLLVDSDVQGSAFAWHERSGAELTDTLPLYGTTLDKDVLKFKPLYERIIIDGIPRVTDLMSCAIKISDLILIPVQPSPYDIWATRDLVDVVKSKIEVTDGKTKAAFIVSRKIVGTNIGKEIYDELSKLELPVFLNGTSQRVSYATSVEKGMSVLDGEFYGSNAHQEITGIVDEIEDFYHGNN